MRGQGQLLALALAAMLLSLSAVDGARVLLQQQQQPLQQGPKVCRYACGRGQTCVDGFCQDLTQLAVISLAPAQVIIVARHWRIQHAYKPWHGYG